MTFSDQTTRQLKAKLNGAHVRTREWQGKTLSYIEGWKAISEANRIFGFDAWDRHTATLKCVSELQGLERSSCAYLAKVRITVRTGPHKVVREGTGAGHASGATLAEAHALAPKRPRPMLPSEHYPPLAIRLAWRFMIATKRACEKPKQPNQNRVCGLSMTATAKSPISSPILTPVPGPCGR